jgi:hypothetical protein
VKNNKPKPKNVIAQLEKINLSDNDKLINSIILANDIMLFNIGDLDNMIYTTHLSNNLLFISIRLYFGIKITS